MEVCLKCEQNIRAKYEEYRRISCENKKGYKFYDCYLYEHRNGCTGICTNAYTQYEISHQDKYKAFCAKYRDENFIDNK